MWNIILAVVTTYITLSIIGIVLDINDKEITMLMIFGWWLYIFQPFLVLIFYPLRRIYLINRGVKNLISKAPNLYKDQEKKLKLAIQRYTHNCINDLKLFQITNYKSFGKKWLKVSLIDWYDDTVEQYGEKKIPLIKWKDNLYE